MVPDCLLLDPFSSQEDFLSPSEVDVSRSEIAQALAVPAMIAMLNNVANLGFKVSVEALPVRKVRDQHQMVAARVADHPFNITFVIPLSRTSIAITEQIMRQQRAEQRGTKSCSIRLYPRDQTAIDDRRKVIKLGEPDLFLATVSRSYRKRNYLANTVARYVKMTSRLPVKHKKGKSGRLLWLSPAPPTRQRHLGLILLRRSQFTIAHRKQSS